MGKVLITLQVMPAGTEVDLAKLEGQIKELQDVGQIKEIRQEEVAFGLKCLKVLTIVDDVGGVAEQIENRLKGLEGVEDARVVDLTLV